VQLPIAPSTVAAKNQTQIIKPDSATDSFDDNPFLKKS